MDLIHLGLVGGGADQEHGLLLMGHLPDDELLQRDHRRLVVLRRGRGVEDGRETKLENSKLDCGPVNFQTHLNRCNDTGESY